MQWEERHKKEKKQKFLPNFNIDSIVILTHTHISTQNMRVDRQALIYFKSCTNWNWFSIQMLGFIHLFYASFRKRPLKLPLPNSKNLFSKYFFSIFNAVNSHVNSIQEQKTICVSVCVCLHCSHCCLRAHRKFQARSIQYTHTYGIRKTIAIW